jgi:hypothetical protein
MTEVLSSFRSHEEHPLEVVPREVESEDHIHAVRTTTAASGRVRNQSANQSRCSFCRAELGEGLELTIPRSGKRPHGASTGRFCSAHCRNCVLALAALHPSPLASDDFVSTRSLLTDRLLELWRRGEGPDPGLVLQAAERAASSGFSTASPAF